MSSAETALSEPPKLSILLVIILGAISALTPLAIDMYVPAMPSIASDLGVIISNMVAFPIAHKLELRKEQEKLNRRLILDGILAIQDGQNPRVIDSYLRNYLNEKKRVVDTGEE